MIRAAQAIATGIGVGAVYSMTGLAFVLVHNVTGVVNLAIGEFLMLGAMTAASLEAGGAPLPVAFLLSIGVASGVAVASDVGALRWARSAPIDTQILVTVGLSIGIQGVALLVWDAQPRALSAFSHGPAIQVLGVAVNRQYLWVVAYVAVVMAGLQWLLTRTRTGRAMRASENNPGAARLAGVNPGTMSIVALVLAGAIAGGAGVVFAPIGAAQYDIGLTLAVKGFTGATIGGLHSPVGAVLGGVIVGVTEQFAVTYIDSLGSTAITFGMLFLVLLVRPQGILTQGKAVRL